MQQFDHDDQGYLRWLAEHPDDFVVNVERVARPGYAVLHRATCQSISSGRDDGAYTGRGYRKIVGEIDELRGFTRSIGRADGSFSKACGHCAPL